MTRRVPSTSRTALTERVLKNKATFEDLVAGLPSLESDDEIISGVSKALEFQMCHSTCYYSSDAIEEALQKIARRHSVPLATEYKKNSVLHVMSQYLSVGGHTRVVERWIARAPRGEFHSVVVLSPPSSMPPRELAENVQSHNGEIFLFEPASVVDKALRLRKLASSFERVVLHVNSEDIVPILAFGAEEFRRPIFLFNHADHIFGLGVSIADVFLDLRSGGAALSLNYRGVCNSHIVHIPCDDRASKDRAQTEENKVRIRGQLGLPLDRRIIVTAASAYKYRPFLEWNFVDYMERILAGDNKCEFIVIGPKSIRGKVRFRDRIHAIGLVDPNICMQYFGAADLVVDSFPFMSFTSIQDALSMGAPILSLKTIMPHLDWVLASESYVSDMEELIRKTRHILENSVYAHRVFESAMKCLQREQQSDQWAEEVQAAYNSASHHSVHKFKSTPTKYPGVLDMFLESKNLHIKSKFRFWRFNMISYVEDGRKRHGVALLPKKCKIRELT